MDDATPITYSRSVNAIALPIFAGFAIVLTLMPLRVLIQVRNIPVCTLIMVITIANLYTFLNAIIWPTEDQASWFSGGGLCDVEVATRAVLVTLLATSTAALTKSVADAVNINTTQFINTHAMRQRKLLKQCAFCFAVPLLQLILHFLVQARRYVVAPIYGCADMTDNSWLSLVILYMWPPIFAVANAYYAVITICFTCKHRLDLQSTLTSSGSGLTAKKFYKLGLLAMSLLIIYLPVTGYFLYLNIPSSFVPYSFQQNRNPAVYNQVLYIAFAYAPLLQYDGWVSVVMGYLIFAFFGLNGQTVASYRKFLVNCGFAKCFPSLLQDSRDRRGSGDDGSGRGSTSRSSWMSPFDILGKACSLFDGSRRGSSRVTTTGTTMSFTESHVSASTRNLSNASEHLPTSHFHLNAVANTSTWPIPSASPQLNPIHHQQPITLITPSHSTRASIQSPIKPAPIHTTPTPIRSSHTHCLRKLNSVHGERCMNSMPLAPHASATCSAAPNDIETRKSEINDFADMDITSSESLARRKGSDKALLRNDADEEVRRPVVFKGSWWDSCRCEEGQVALSR